jgi:hypothetical protein
LTALQVFFLLTAIEHFQTSLHGQAFIYGLRHGLSGIVSNVHRTVVMTNLPTNVTPGALFNKIRDGKVYSLTMMDTTPILGCLSALVTFFREESAAVFVQRATVIPIIYDGKHARVTLVKTATYPMKRDLEWGIINKGYSRVVTIVDCNNPAVVDSLIKDVLWELAYRSMPGAMEAFFAGNEDLEMRFTSVWAANEVYEYIAKSPIYDDYDLAFGEDPCARK